jgi:hypothetical protein
MEQRQRTRPHIHLELRVRACVHERRGGPDNVPVLGMHSGESLQGFDGFFEGEGVKSVVYYVGSMDGDVKRLEDTNLMEPPWLGWAGRVKTVDIHERLGK